ncbi:uncharacterized protein AC631_04346 [Debaryomyces fabryi]|uniref:O-methyltransferase domain-containing protein n=1 Tax=Debaryomyces fabryi TaxID=58627 RepID=A0A0V1PVA2_9ASCO|nr:uncharacterized protein AC631_04346 [Debaryomyces fabryi]KRZ99902.1 hypothetical protein AC631_04346 [Debaryomyces fabryi]CUM57485.1 unnamed protein product [Debaryomyces fabryi]
MTGLGVPGVFKLVMGKWFSRITYTGVYLGVFEKLSTTEPKLAEEVSREIKVHTDTLYRLLRALSLIGLVEENEEYKFLLNEDGSILRKDHPMSLRGLFLFEESLEHLVCWKHLPDFVKEGPKKTAFEIEFGKPIFDYMDENPKYATIFGNAMDSISYKEIEGIVNVLKEGNYLDKSGVICDIGGSSGYFLDVVLNSVGKPGVKGIVSDTATVINDVKSNGKDAALLKNLSFAEVDMFKKAVPADVYFVKHILHDWPDDKCIEILRLAKAVANPGAKFIACEAVILEPNVPSLSKVLDIQMMLMCCGRQRTESEFKKLYEAAGWKLEAVKPCGDDFISLVIGTI